MTLDARKRALLCESALNRKVLEVELGQWHVRTARWETRASTAQKSLELSQPHRPRFCSAKIFLGAGDCAGLLQFSEVVVNTPLKFGTDGWRAVIAEDFTFANVDRVTQASADYWNANPPPNTRKKIIVGYDRRFLSDQFARRAAEVLTANGFQVVLTSEPTPTPAVSYAVKAQDAAGGVMITASHNPPSFNGFKLKAHFGGSAEPVHVPGDRGAARQESSARDGAELRRPRSLISARHITRLSRNWLISSRSRARRSSSRTMPFSASARVASRNCWPARPAK